MEPKAPYNAGQVETPVICPDCQSQLGMMVESGKLVWLIVGGMRLNAAHGQCNCGAPFHWTAVDIKLARLVEKSRKHLPNRPNGL